MATFPAARPAVLIEDELLIPVDAGDLAGFRRSALSAKLFFGLLLLLVSTGCSSGDGGLPDRGLAALEDWDAMPVLGGSRYRQFSSFDRVLRTDYSLVDAANKDFNNFLAACGELPGTIYQEVDDQSLCEPGAEGYLIAVADGPGFVSRIWFTTASLLSAGFALDEEEIHIYVDDLDRPAYRGPLADWVADTGRLPFSKPFTAVTSGSLASYFPVSFESRLRIYLTELDTNKFYYYHVDVRSCGPTARFGENALDADRLASIGQMLDGGAREGEGADTLLDEQVALVAGKDTVVLDHPGSGTIQLLRFAFDDVGAAELRDLTLRVYWDGLARPAIDLPLAAFFGCHQEIAVFDTLPMRVAYEGGQLLLSFHLPMPFSSGAELRLENGGSRDLSAGVRIDASPGTPAGDWGYLHARFQRRVEPVEEGSRYPVIDVEGPGRHVGTMMFMKGRADPDSAFPSPFTVLEGDEEGVIDGQLDIRGTGTEDYFNGGWYFLDGYYDHPFGAFFHSDKDPEGQTSETSVVRWHLLSDAIDFDESFSLTFEYGPDRPDLALEYASVAYFYLR